MKRVLLLSGIFMMFSCQKQDRKDNKDSVAGDTVAVKDSIPSKRKLTSVEAIKSEYNIINMKLQAKKLDSLSFDYECNEISGNVVYYSENGILKVVRHFSADSHFSSVENYFVRDGKPFFVFKDETVWSFDGGTPEKPETKDNITQQRMYIADHKIIKCLEKTFTIKSSLAENPKPEDVPNRESKNCSPEEVQKTFELLMKNTHRKGKTNCL